MKITYSCLGFVCCLVLSVGTTLVPRKLHATTPPPIVLPNVCRDLGVKRVWGITLCTNGALAKARMQDLGDGLAIDLVTQRRYWDRYTYVGPTVRASAILVYEVSLDESWAATNPGQDVTVEWQVPLTSMISLSHTCNWSVGEAITRVTNRFVPLSNNDYQFRADGPCEFGQNYGVQSSKGTQSFSVTVSASEPVVRLTSGTGLVEVQEKGSFTVPTYVFSPGYFPYLSAGNASLFVSPPQQITRSVVSAGVTIRRVPLTELAAEELGRQPQADELPGEFTDGTASADTDIDGDGIFDADEVALGLNFFIPDSDGDGLSDGDEIEANTDPLDEDSDNDGVLDSVDAFPNDDTESADTDGDGLGDNRESALGTRPDLSDSDRDGFSDGEEVLQLGTNPLDPDDPPPSTGLPAWLLMMANDAATESESLCNDPEDADQDCVIGALDICPSTPNGEVVDVEGCSSSQKTTAFCEGTASNFTQSRLVECDPAVNLDDWYTDTAINPDVIPVRLAFAEGVRDYAIPASIPQVNDRPQINFPYGELQLKFANLSAGDIDVWFSLTPGGEPLPGANCFVSDVQMAAFATGAVPRWTQDINTAATDCYIGTEAKIIYVNFDPSNINPTGGDGDLQVIKALFRTIVTK